MNLSNQNKWIAAGLSCALRIFTGGTFVFSGLVKLLEPYENFRGILAQYELIPHFLNPILAHSIPWLEFLTGVFLILGFSTGLAASLAGGLAAGFALLLAVSMLMKAGLPAHCGCFGQALALSLKQMLVLDLVNALSGLYLVLKPCKALALDRFFPDPKGGEN